MPEEPKSYTTGSRAALMDWDQLSLDDLIRVAMESHFALQGRGPEIVTNRLHEMLAERQERARQLEDQIANIRRQQEKIRAELPGLKRRARWLHGPRWECASAE